MADWLLRWLFGDQKKFGVSMGQHPFKTTFKLLLAATLILIATCIVALAVAWTINTFGPSDQEKQSPYISTQTVFLNSGFTDFSYLDIDGRGWLVPLQFETLLKAREFGEVVKGEMDTIYMGRVVVTALDPSMRYVELESGISTGTAYEEEDLYTFYLPDGNDVTDNKLREHIIEIRDKKYKIILLTIDTRDKEDLPKYAYTFRIEEIK